ncbi:hypothetical protein ALC62_01412 [Cyphomyrmex costatus]|uniref:Uncharacterized protein n=1 Tax=Cyphomyrmex costatus TaxID=456900 RepID=A0A195D3X7_9HYME|nr:hypothetical protein ALC62_01412 [Cyphomyrmex costatus]
MSVTIMMRQNHAAGSRRKGFLDTRPCSRIINYNIQWHRMDKIRRHRYFKSISIFRMFTRHCKARRRRLRECRGRESRPSRAANVFGVASTPRVTVQATHVAVVRSHLSWSHLLFPAA